MLNNTEKNNVTQSYVIISVHQASIASKMYFDQTIDHWSFREKAML